jgi:hypothetical protein
MATRGVEIRHPQLQQSRAIHPNHGLPQGRMDSSCIISAYLSDLLEDIYHQACEMKLGVTVAGATLPWIQYMDDIILLAPSIAKMKCFSTSSEIA